MAEPFVANDVPVSADDYKKSYGEQFPQVNKLSDDAIASAVYQQGIATGKIKNQTLDDLKVGFLPNRPENNAQLYRQTFQDKFPDLKSKTDAEIANNLWDYRTKVLKENLTTESAPHFQQFLNTVAPKEYHPEVEAPQFLPDTDISKASTTDIKKPVTGQYVDAMGTVYGPTAQVVPNNAISGKNLAWTAFDAIPLTTWAVPRSPGVETSNRYTLNDIANATGIDLPNNVTDNANSFTGPRMAASFGSGEQNKVLGLKIGLSKSLGIPPEQINIRNGDKTGEYEFFNPKTNHWTLTNSSGLNAGDFGEIAGAVPEILGNIFGTTFGAIAGGTAGATAGTATLPGVGTITGAGGGAVAGAYSGGVGGTMAGAALRDAMGYWFYGINQDTNSIQEALKVMPDAAKWQAAGMAIPALFGFAKKIVNVGKIATSDLTELGVKAKDAVDLQEKINGELIKAGSKEQLQFMPGQASADPGWLAIEGAFEKSPDVGISGPIHTINEKNARALNALFALRNQGYGGAEFDPAAVGQRIKTVLEDRQVNPVIQTLAEKQAKAEADLTNAVITLPNGVQKESGQTIRNHIMALQENEGKPFDMQYDALFAAGQGRLVNTDIIENAINQLDAAQKNNFVRTKDVMSILNLADMSSPIIPVNRNALQNAFNTLGGEQKFKLLKTNPDFKDLMEAKYNIDLPLNKNILLDAFQGLNSEQQQAFNSAFPNFKDITKSQNRVVFVDRNELQKGINALDKEGQSKIFENYAGLNRSLSSPEVAPVNKETIKDVLNSLSEKDRANFISKYPDLQNIVEGNALPLENIRSAQSTIKAKLRDIQTGARASDVNEGSYKFILNAIDKQLESDLKYDPWLMQYKNISSNYSTYMNKFNQGALKDMLTYDNGRLKMADEDVFQSSFKYGKAQQDRINSVYNVIKDNPEAMEAYKQAILDFYRSKAVSPRTGEFDLGAHNQFLTLYKPSLETIFGKDNYPQISKLGGLGELVEKTIADNKIARQKLFESTAGKIVDLGDSEGIFSKIYNPDKPQKFIDVVNILRNEDNPEALNSLKQTVINDLTNKTAITDPNFKVGQRTGSFNYQKFIDYLKDNKVLLDTVFKDNPEYLNNLQEFSKTLQTLSRKTTIAVGETDKNALTDLIRKKIGMFTTSFLPTDYIKAAFSAGLKSRMNEVVTNPDLLKKLVSLKDLSMTPKNLDTYNATVLQLFGSQFNPDWFQPTPEGINKYGSPTMPIPLNSNQNNQNNKPKTNSPTLNKISNEQSSLQNPVNTNITNPQLPNKDLFAMNVKPSGAGITAGGMSSIPQGELAEAGALSRL